MAIADNPFGGDPFGEGPFGPQPEEGEEAAAPSWGWHMPFGRAVRVGAIALIVGGSPFVPKEATVENTVTTTWPLTKGEVARPINRPAPQGHHLFVPREATLENTTVRVWPLTQGETARPIPRAAKQGYHLFVPKEATLENTTVRVWPLTQGLKAAPVLRPAKQGHHLFVPKEATVENTTVTVWPLVVRDEKAHPIPRVAPPGQWVSGYPQEAEDNTRTAWDWYLPFPDRAPHTFAKQGHHLFVPAEATVENTTVRVWPLTFGEKARPIPRVAPQGAWVFGYPYEGVDNTRSEWDWYNPFPDRFPQTFWKGKPYQPFVPAEATRDNTTNKVWPLTQGEKARPIPLPAKQGHHLFVPREATLENTTNRVWPLTQGERARPIPRAPQGYWSFGYPYEQEDNTRSEWDWYKPFPDRAPRFEWKGRPYQPFVPREAVIDNTTVRVWPLTQGLVARPIPRPAQQGMWTFGYPYEQAAISYNQSVDCEIILTVDFHICGWGTETQEPDAGSEQSQQADAWTSQDEQSVAFVEESEQSDPWSEQTESDDDYDEQDECGR